MRVALSSLALMLCLTARGEEPLVPVPAPMADPAPDADATAPGWLTGQLMLGQQLGVRGQMRVAQFDDWTLSAEGFYGALLVNFGSSETAGGGLRAYTRRTSADGHKALLLGPGVNFFYQFDDGGLPIVAPSLDLSWMCGFGNGCGWEIGLNAGFGVSLSERRDGRDVNAGEVTPIISIFSGFRF